MEAERLAKRQRYLDQKWLMMRAKRGECRFTADPDAYLNEYTFNEHCILVLMREKHRSEGCLHKKFMDDECRLRILTQVAEFQNRIHAERRQGRPPFQPNHGDRGWQAFEILEIQARFEEEMGPFLTPPVEEEEMHCICVSTPAFKMNHEPACPYSKYDDEPNRNDYQRVFTVNPYSGGPGELTIRKPMVVDGVELKPGDKCTYTENEDGEWVIEPVGFGMGVGIQQYCDKLQQDALEMLGRVDLVKPEDKVRVKEKVKKAKDAIGDLLISNEASIKTLEEMMAKKLDGSECSCDLRPGLVHADDCPAIAEMEAFAEVEAKKTIEQMKVFEEAINEAIESVPVCETCDGSGKVPTTNPENIPESFDPCPTCVKWEDFAIWWTTEANCKKQGSRLGKKIPEYIRKQYDNRYGRNGRGRLWCEDNFPKDCFCDEEWEMRARNLHIADCAGIVIRRQDVEVVSKLQGFITDDRLVFLTEENR